MLPDDVVLKNCYYWASKMIQKGIDFDELVNVGYVAGKPLRDARLLKDHLHYRMLHFIQREQKMETSDILDIPVDADSKSFESLYLAIKSACLTEQEMNVLILYFFKDYKQREIASRLDITQATVACYLKRAVKKIKRALEQREKKHDTESKGRVQDRLH